MHTAHSSESSEPLPGSASTPALTRTRKRAIRHHPDPYKKHNHAFPIEGHTSCNTPADKRLEHRSCEQQKWLRARGPSVQTPPSTLCPVVGSCGAAREVHRQYGWMDEMLITGARRAPAAIINMVESTRTSTPVLTCDAPMRVRLSYVNWAGLR